MAFSRGQFDNLCIQSGSGAHPASCTMATGVLSPGEKHSHGVMLTIRPLIAPRLKCRRCTSSSPKASPWHVVGPLYLAKDAFG
jgi:hypothetical protein